MADQLRERLSELARQVADLEVDVAKKDAQIRALAHQKAEVERKYGVPMSERTSDYVPRADYEDVILESAGLREQLVAVMEELAARERELAEMQDVHHRYQSRLTTYADQVKALYREHAGALAMWRGEKKLLAKSVNRLKVWGRVCVPGDEGQVAQPAEGVGYGRQEMEDHRFVLYQEARIETVKIELVGGLVWVVVLVNVVDGWMMFCGGLGRSHGQRSRGCTHLRGSELLTHLWYAPCTDAWLPGECRRKSKGGGKGGGEGGSTGQEGRGGQTPLA
eukprot:364281-Chlamydomonas_euryale.AAC.1